MSAAAVREGRFIVLEGIDGAGTTTHSKRLVEALRSRSIECQLTCEPTSGPIGTLIRQVLQKRLIAVDGSSPRSFAWSTMALLFAADRLDHLDSVVIPAMKNGVCVISDRYDLSSLAYQSVTAPPGQRVVPWIRDINGQAIRPDLTIVLDVSSEVAARRRIERSSTEELFEGRVIQDRLAAVYAEAEELVPGDRIVHVSAMGSIEEVGARILEVALHEITRVSP